MSGKTLELNTGVPWEAKYELNRVAFYLKSDITLPLYERLEEY